MAQGILLRAKIKEILGRRERRSIASVADEAGCTVAVLKETCRKYRWRLPYRAKYGWGQ